MSVEPAPVESLIGESYALGRVFCGRTGPGDEFVDVDLEECRFEDAVMERSVWRRCAFDGCVFDRVNLSMATFVDVRFADCTIRESKAQAVNWTRARAGGLAQQAITFERCRLDYGTFIGLDLRGMRFVGCSLVDADFTESDCRGVEFIDCDLSGARFHGADLRGAGCFDVRGLALDVREARTLGLRVDAGAALEIVHALGIEIVETPPTE
ncbi:MAG TPA: pentapeptide repeat-containing protein [Intrasporangiaceae bacterium]|nr:pentapeptide repeat-containing protein [Intrasporangiaceae bacterium]